MVFWENSFHYPAQHPRPDICSTVREQTASHQARSVCTAVLQGLLQPCGWNTLTGSSDGFASDLLDWVVGFFYKKASLPIPLTHLPSLTLWCTTRKFIALTTDILSCLRHNGATAQKCATAEKELFQNRKWRNAMEKCVAETLMCLCWK